MISEDPSMVFFFFFIICLRYRSQLHGQLYIKWALSSQQHGTTIISQKPIGENHTLTPLPTLPKGFLQSVHEMSALYHSPSPCPDLFLFTALIST